MKVTVHGWNYEGMAFRGYGSDTDEQSLKITLEGDEQDICVYILEQFSYGSSDEDPITSIADLAEGYEAGEIPNGDGCGGIDAIIDENGEFLFAAEWAEDDYKSALDLGTVQLTGNEWQNEHLNDLVGKAMIDLNSDSE